MTPTLDALHAPGDAAPRPHGNCYWLVPGVLMAGEYPGAPDEDTACERLDRILQAGVRHFIDLTEATEPLAPYAATLQARAAAQGVHAGHQRHAIRDLGVPTAATMRGILEALRAPRDGATYVHCWGGIGRTGTVMGCLLVELGLTADDALALIARKWRAMDKRHRNPHSPETDEQVRFIRAWQRDGSWRLAPPAAVPNTRDDEVWYFAFGSNMDPARLIDARLTPRGVPVTRRIAGTATGWRLTFHKPWSAMAGAGVADIVADPSSTVHGTLNRMPPAGLDVLDGYEGTANGHYRRTPIEVHAPALGHAVQAVAYTACGPFNPLLRPTRTYLNHLLAGRDLLPQDHVQWLMGQAVLGDASR